MADNTKTPDNAGMSTGEKVAIGAAGLGAAALGVAALPAIAEGAELMGGLGIAKSLFEKKEETPEEPKQSPTPSPIADVTQKIKQPNFDSIDRNIARQEAVLMKGFWFGSNRERVNAGQVKQTMQGDPMGFLVAKIFVIDNKLTRLDENMKGIRKVLEDHLVLERDRLAEDEISQQESSLKYSQTHGEYDWLGAGKRLNNAAGGSLLPFLTVALLPTLMSIYNTFAKMTWDGAQRLMGGIVAATKSITIAMNSLYDWASRKKNTLLGKLQPEEKIASEIEKPVEALKNGFTASERAFLAKAGLEERGKFFKDTNTGRLLNAQEAKGLLESMPKEKAVEEATEGVGKLLAKATGRIGVKLSAKAAKALSYLIPIQSVLKGIAKFAKLLMFLDPLIALLKVGIGEGSWSEVGAAFSRAFGSLLGGWAGAELGALIGSVVPGFGTLVGALVGGFLGASAGEYLASKLWELITTFNFTGVGSEIVNDIMSELRLGVGLLTGTTPVTAGNLATLAGVNPFTGGDNNNRVSGTGAGSSENAKKAMDYFTSQGWTPAQAAGIVGNLQAESGRNLDPSINQIGGGPGYGIGQWGPDRQADFRNKYGKDIHGTSLEEQLAFVQYELTSGKDRGARIAGQMLRGAATSDQASDIITNKYERPKGGTEQRRRNNAASLITPKEKGSSPPYSETKSQSGTSPKIVSLKGTQQMQSQQYGIPSPFASTSYDDRVSVFFNANEPMMGVGMAT